MNEEFPIQLTGSIYWLPPHRPEKPAFPPESFFRALAKFTSDFSVSYTASIAYSADVLDQGFHKVSLYFAFGDIDTIQKLAKNSEIVIMDGYKVIAVCRYLVA